MPSELVKVESFSELGIGVRVVEYGCPVGCSKHEGMLVNFCPKHILWNGDAIRPLYMICDAWEMAPNPPCTGPAVVEMRSGYAIHEGVVASGRLYRWTDLDDLSEDTETDARRPAPRRTEKIK